MTRPLMPKATAVWLLDNTTLSFEQIADFCQMHTLEIQAIADGEVASHIMGLDPVANGQLTKEEIERCQADENARLQINVHEDVSHLGKKGVRYTPMAKREDRPAAIMWLLSNHPELEDLQIVKLIRTTRKAIASIRDKSHKNYEELQAKSPVLAGLCTQAELDQAVATAVKIIPVDKV
ncbi:MAG: DUF1013 domain-containing protein [Alphaproteobacteria bacterium]|nr:DUF1013 domain-containing protein [Alphaproteobacteria bacterium]